MGEKVEETKKSEGEEKGGDNDGKKEENAPAPIVLKLDLHCEGCAKKLQRAIRRYEGVHDVTTEASNNKLIVNGNVDPIWLRDKVATNTKKEVELVSPQPQKDGGAGAGVGAVAGAGGDKKPVDEKAEKKPQDDKPKESTEVLKIRLHCDGCAHKIKRMISKFNGVDHVSMDHLKDLVTVKGTMDIKELAHYLKQKLKRPVEIVQPKKEDGGGEKKKNEGGGGGKKEKEGEGGGQEKKESEAKATRGEGGGGKGIKNEAPKVDANKYEYQGYNPYTYYSSALMYNNQSYSNQDYYGMTTLHDQGHPTTGHVVQYSNMPETSQYATNYWHMPPPAPSYVHAPQIFSDENPNGCSVM